MVSFPMSVRNEVKFALGVQCIQVKICSWYTELSFVLFGCFEELFFTSFICCTSCCDRIHWNKHYMCANIMQNDWHNQKRLFLFVCR